MTSACSSAWRMIFGIVRCEVLSAADSAIDVIPGTEAMTWKPELEELGAIHDVTGGILDILGGIFGGGKPGPGLPRPGSH